MSDFKIVKLLDPIQMSINGTFNPMGAYNAATDYAVGDQVDYNGSSYIMYNNAAAGTVPTNTSYWGLVAEKGDTGATGATGPTGPAGSDGADGAGVPIGGTTGQVLSKNSNTDFDTEWVTPATDAVTSVNTRTGAVTGLAEASDLTAHTGNTSNPHSVTKAQVGLSNVDNTSDAAKPISTATQTALDGKFTQRTITGTTNQITVTNGDGVSGNPTFSTPQDIHTGASPTFTSASLTATGASYLHINASTTPLTVSEAQLDLASGSTYARHFYRDSDKNYGFFINGLTMLRMNGTVGSRSIQLTADTYPSADSTYTLGTSSLYWSNTYTDRLYLNSTAYIDGASAGRMAATGQFYATDSKTSGAGDYTSHSLSTSASGTFTGNLFSLSIRPTTTVSIGWLVGTKYNPVAMSAANLGAMKAFYAVPEHASTGTITEMMGAEIQPYITTATGAVTTVRMLKLSQWGGGAGNGTIGTFYGLVIDNPMKTVTGNSYGIIVGSIPCSGTAYSIETQNGNIVFNQGGDANSDVRIEGDTDQNLLFTDASTDRVGIGTNAPDEKPHIAGNLKLADSNIVLGTTTGTKIGTSTSQKLGFFNATPVVKPSATPANATDLATAITLVNDLKSKLVTLGLIA